MEARFATPVQTGPKAHPASCTVDIGCVSGGLKRPVRENHPQSSSAKGKERVELFHYPASGPLRFVLGRISVDFIPDWYRVKFNVLPFTSYVRIGCYEG